MNRRLKQVRRIIVSVLLGIFMILIISTLPSLFSYGRPSVIQWYSNSDEPDFIGKKLYKLHFNPDNLWRKPFLYFRQIQKNKIFTYIEGKTPRNYLEQAPRYFGVSFFYLSISGTISLILGLFISLQNSNKRRNPAFYEFMSFMTVFPDFILIFIIQFLFFFINRAAGGMFIRLYTVSASDRAVVLPLAAMCTYPTLYIIRTIGNHLKEVNNEPYILFARAKGLSEVKIRFFHIGPAALRFISGDLHKILAILFANLFITELMFNNKGITSFLFYNIHQYTATVNTIVLMLLLYLAVLICLLTCLFLLGMILRRSRP